MIAAAPATTIAIITDRSEFRETTSRVFSDKDGSDNRLIHLTHGDLLEFPCAGFPDAAICDLVTGQDEAIPSVFHLASVHDIAKTVFLLDPSDGTRISNWLHILHRLGARACVSSLQSVERLPDILHDVRDGQEIISTEFESFFCADEAVSPTKLKGPLAQITLRQIEILVLLATGRTVQQVAGVLHLSSRTVESHKYHMMKTLDCECLIGLCRFAIRHGLLNP